jgi:hypothetical protein
VFKIFFRLLSTLLRCADCGNRVVAPHLLEVGIFHLLHSNCISHAFLGDRGISFFGLGLEKRRQTQWRSDNHSLKAANAV